jgi:hypothetical protein
MFVRPGMKSLPGTNLVHKIVNYDRKKFYNIGPSNEEKRFIVATPEMKTVGCAQSMKAYNFIYYLCFSWCKRCKKNFLDVLLVS